MGLPGELTHRNEMNEGGQGLRDYRIARSIIASRPACLRSELPREYLRLGRLSLTGCGLLPKRVDAPGALLAAFWGADSPLVRQPPGQLPEPPCRRISTGPQMNTDCRRWISVIEGKSVRLMDRKRDGSSAAIQCCVACLVNEGRAGKVTVRLTSAHCLEYSRANADATRPISSYGMGSRRGNLRFPFSPR
jgi:hypothetical protein